MPRTGKFRAATEALHEPLVVVYRPCLGKRIPKVFEATIGFSWPAVSAIIGEPSFPNFHVPGPARRRRTIQSP
jgi:hypothetical protein